jgi:hypothetical protein
VDVLATPVNAPQVLKLWNGDLLMSGGAIEEVPLISSTGVLRWRSSASGFAMAGEMGVGRVWHSQAQISDSLIIITGGWLTNESATRTSDLLNLATGMRSAGPLMATGRRYLQTVSVPVTVGEDTEIRVLAIAGHDRLTGNLTSVEVLTRGTLHAGDEHRAQGVRAFPNPTADRCSIDLDLSSAAPVRLVLADLLGNEVICLDEGIRSGAYHRDLHLRELPAGSYLLRVQAGEHSMIRKIVKE